MSGLTSTYRMALPWAASEQENKRFNRITLVSLALTLGLALAVKWQQLPEQTRAEKQKLPPTLTRIITAQKTLPKPVVKPKPIEKPKPVVEKKPPAPDAPKPKPEAVKPKPASAKPEAKKVPEPKVVKTPSQAERQQKAREMAQQSGLLALSDDLASMRSSMRTEGGANAQQMRGAGNTPNTQRQFVGRKVSTASGGLDTSRLSSDAGARGELAARQGGQYRAPDESMASLAAKQLEAEQTVVGDRDLESIRQVLDASKGAIYAVYRRALRQDPSLQGKVTVNLQIEPDGSVSKVTLVSSELDSPDLEKKLLARIRLINFGEQSVSRTALDYSFNFLPF